MTSSQIRRFCYEAKVGVWITQVHPVRPNESRSFPARKQYRYHDRLTKDVLNAIEIYKSLVPKLDYYIYENGEEENLICLDGTIPITYRKANYYIPVCIYLRKDHPESKPICYVRPTSQMTIKESRNVDSQGKVLVPYLDNWSSARSDLTCLIQVMVVMFSETPPVYKKPEASMQQSPSNSSMRSGFQSRFRLL